jgi:hypothetical protein
VAAVRILNEQAELSRAFVGKIARQENARATDRFTLADRSRTIGNDPRV